MRRLIATTTMIALAASGTLALGQAGSAAPTGASAKPQPTHFALKTAGYGTRIKGGQVPAGSKTTAYQVIGCTNRAGLAQENHQAEETLPGAGTASEIKTRVWTTEKSGVVSAWSRNTVARITISDNPLGSVEINGIKSVSRAFHDPKGFHAENLTAIASVSFTPAAGEPQELEVPSPGQPLEIPGVATIAVGNPVKKSGASGAVAENDAIIIDAVASGSKVRVAHTETAINGGIKSGVFGGFASAARAVGLAGNVSVGYTPLQVMPCQGTDGKLRQKGIATLDLGGQVAVSGLATKERASQTGQRSTGFTQAKVAGVELGGGQLTVAGIVGRANVEREGSKLTRTSKGTHLGTVTVNGEPQSFPDTDVIEIPGVARLERNIVKRFKSGIYVTALRITLLDGTGAVVNLGEARLRIRPSGN